MHVTLPWTSKRVTLNGQLAFRLLPRASCGPKQYELTSFSEEGEVLLCVLHQTSTSQLSLLKAHPIPPLSQTFSRSLPSQERPWALSPTTFLLHSLPPSPISNNLTSPSFFTTPPSLLKGTPPTAHHADQASALQLPRPGRHGQGSPSR